MAVEVARRVAAAIRQIFERLVDFSACGARAFVMRVDVGEIDKDALRRNASVAGALPPEIGRALAHHDLASVDLHLAMHAASRRSYPHDLLEAKDAGEPFERRRDVAIEDVRDNFAADFGWRFSHDGSPWSVPGE